MSCERHYTVGQIIHHGATIADWHTKGRPKMQFRNNISEGWVDVVGTPAWAKETEYRFKPDLITLYQIIDAKTGWPRQCSIDKKRMEARAAYLNSSLCTPRYEVVKMVQVPDDEC